MTRKASQIDEAILGPHQEDVVLLALGMVLLGLATFVALLGFVELCDRV